MIWHNDDGRDLHDRWVNSHLHWIFAHSNKYHARIATTLYRLAVLGLLIAIAIGVQ